MSRYYSIAAPAFILAAAFILSFLSVDHAQAFRLCTFKGTVVDHGWRSMTVKSGAQCAEVNVGWRTKYIPNRRPCLGERVAVDFMLEDGYMKATKVVSLTPMPQSVQCYPPPPPSGSVCRSVPDEGRPTDTCAPARPICTNRPPSHVTDQDWSPGKKEPSPKNGKTEKKTEKKPKPEAKRGPTAPPVKVPPEEPKTQEKPPVTSERYESLTGEVVASSPKSLSIRVSEEGEAAEVVNVRVGLKTKFVPFRRPAVGERVKVDYLKENGDKFGHTVQVIQ